MVQAHELKGLSPDNPLALILATLAQGLGKPVIVINGGDQPATARKEAGLLEIFRALRVILQFHGVARLMQVTGGEPVLLVRAHLEACLGHTQWFKYMLLEIVIQRFTGEQLDQIADHICRYRVVPGGPWRKLQW